MNILVSENKPQLFQPIHRKSVGWVRKMILDENTRHPWSSLLPQKTTSSNLSRTQPLPHSNSGIDIPHSNDVVCARGKKYWDHSGNQMYRKLISLAKKHYESAPNRLVKSWIVSEIISHVHKTDGRFLKQIYKNGSQQRIWVECETSVVREKVTQSLRDGLSSKYSSSTARKKKRKACVQELYLCGLHRTIHSNNTVSKKIIDFEKKVEWLNHQHQGRVKCEETMAFFTATNLDILESIKKENLAALCQHYDTG